MNRRQFSAATLRLALALLGAPALRPARGQEARPDPAKVFQEVRPSNDAFEFEMHGFAYHIKANGNGWRKRKEKTRRFNLRVDGRIERLYYTGYRGDVLLVCELNREEAGAGFVTLLEQPSMRARWGLIFDISNVGEPLHDGRHLYVTADGDVAMIDLDKGETLWEHGELRGRAGEGTFSAFALPEVSGDTVTFKEKRPDGPAHRVVVNRKTGKIVSVE